MQYLQPGLREPQRNIIRDSRCSWSYSTLLRNVESASRHLLRAPGFHPGGSVGIVMERTVESVARLLAIWNVGGIAVPIAVRAAPREIAFQIADAKLVVVMAARQFSGVVEQACELLEGIDRPNLIDLCELGKDQAPVPLRSLAESDPALILYTSGTTGRPKGVLHTHSSLMAQLSSLHQAWRWSPHDSLLHVLPLHHIHGLVNGLLGALWAGAGLEFMDQFSAAAVWQSFAERRISVFYAVPTIYHQLIEACSGTGTVEAKRWANGAGNLRLTVSGSAALPASLWSKWREVTGQPLLERYGMTEIGMAISNPYDGERRAGTVGQPLPKVEVRIVNESGEDVPNGSPGEIWVRGPTLFSKYLNHPQATADAFHDGYFRTGDMAETHDGYVRILGRASVDILKSAGYKISALEIEEVLLENPAIREVAVVGCPDIEWGEIVTACIVLRAANVHFGLEELRNWCANKLASYKIPRRLEVVTALPRNALGKVTKAEIVRRLDKRVSEEKVSDTDLAD